MPQPLTAVLCEKTQHQSTLDKKGTTEQKRSKSNNRRFSCSPSAVLSTGVVGLKSRPSRATLQRSSKRKTSRARHEKDAQGSKLGWSTHNTAPHHNIDDLLSRGPF